MIYTDRWQQVKELLDRSFDLPTDQRRAFLERSCGGDELLQAQLDALIEEEARLGGFLETPIFELKRPPIDEGRLAQERIGPYRMIRTLGRGGMGSVYLARRDDDEYDKEVAIKVIRRGPDNRELQRRFLMERQILANLHHPNIAELHDGGTVREPGRKAPLSYLVMEFVDGVDIVTFCDRERLSVDRRLELFEQVCSGVQAAHRSLIVHRDLKPANILVNVEGVPKLLDFGIAKPLDSSSFPQAVETTGPWLRPMTPVYASPEQVRGENVTTATDVYSLVVVLYQLLTGHPPYRSGLQGCHTVEDAILRQEVAPPSEFLSSLFGQPGEGDSESTDSSLEEICQRRGVATPRQLQRRLAGDLDTIVLMALRKDPDRRYASVEQLAEDLRRFRTGLPVKARKDTSVYRVRKFVTRNKLAVGSALLLTTLVVGFAVAMTILAARLRASDQRTRGLADRAATLAQELGTALDEWQEEEVRRKEEEAARMSLEGKSAEAESLRADVENVRSELESRNRTLEALRSEMGLEDDDGATQLIARIRQIEARLTETELELDLERRRASDADEAHAAALERIRSTERRLADQGQELAAARREIQELQAPAPPSTTGTDLEACVSGQQGVDQGFEFVRVCAGTYTVGSSSEDRLAYEDELPVHEVTLSEFWIGKFEVTNAQLRRRFEDHQGEAQLPASTVGWTQARKFCKSFGFDLPTEAEWEVAARGGTESRWFFGDSVDDLGNYAWFEGNSGDTTHPVGQKQPNPWGIHDMYGNLWEWVADMWGRYSGEDEVNPRGPPVTAGSRRIVRGGAFDDGARVMRSAFRGGVGPVFRRRDVGFRCVRRLESDQG